MTEESASAKLFTPLIQIEYCEEVIRAGEKRFLRAAGTGGRGFLIKDAVQ